MKKSRDVEWRHGLLWSVFKVDTAIAYDHPSSAHFYIFKPTLSLNFTTMTTEVIFKPNSKSTDEFKIIVNYDGVCICLPEFSTLSNVTDSVWHVVHEMERMESRRWAFLQM